MAFAELSLFRDFFIMAFAELSLFKMARGIMPFAELSLSILQIPRNGDRSHNFLNWLAICFLFAPKGSPEFRMFLLLPCGGDADSGPISISTLSAEISSP